MTEVGQFEFYDHVYEVARQARAGLPCLAVFSTSYRIDELINVTAVMGRRDGVEEWLHLDNVWRAESRAAGGRFHLPISEQELERLKWTTAT